MTSLFAELGGVLAPRRKAVLALLIPLIGGLIALYPDNGALQLAGVIITALGTAVGVHQVTNKAAGATEPPVGSG